VEEDIISIMLKKKDPVIGFVSFLRPRQKSPTKNVYIMKVEEI